MWSHSRVDMSVLSVRRAVFMCRQCVHFGHMHLRFQNIKIYGFMLPGGYLPKPAGGAPFSPFKNGTGRHCARGIAFVQGCCCESKLKTFVRACRFLSL